MTARRLATHFLVVSAGEAGNGLWLLKIGRTRPGRAPAGADGAREQNGTQHTERGRLDSQRATGDNEAQLAAAESPCSDEALVRLPMRAQC